MFQTTVLGEIITDPLLKNIQDKTVVNFTLVHHLSFKDKSGKPIVRSTWIDCSFWNDKIFQLIGKGDTVLIQGELSATAYIYAKTNEPKAALHLKVLNLEIAQKNRV